MIQQNVPLDYDPSVHISDFSLVERLGDSVLPGNWFVFLKANWLHRSGMEQLLALSGVAASPIKSTILFRGKDELTLPGATLSPKTLPSAQLVSLTSDKALYRANRDTVRLLIAAPLQANATLTLQVRLGGNPYADYRLA